MNSINKLEQKILKAKYLLTVDYNSIIKEEIQKKFQIDLNEQSSDVEIKNNYEEILKRYQIEETDLAENIRSLLYFENNSEQIEDHLKEQFGSDEEEMNSCNSDLKITGTLTDASLSKNGRILQTSSYSGNGKGSWVHSSFGDRGKKRRGKAAEEMVYNTLVNKFGIENVRWVSGNSTTPNKNDKLHYDIEYKNESDVWKFVEVKAISDNQFIISGAEKDKGISEPDNFEMALVKDDIIYMVRDIFKFKHGETFENNSKFTAFPKDYVFVFDVKSSNAN